MVDTQEAVVERQDELESTDEATTESDTQERGDLSSSTVKAQFMTVTIKTSSCKVENVSLIRDCIVRFDPPSLTITEFKRLDPKIIEKQAWHLSQRWFNPKIGRREARHILNDFWDTKNSFLVRSSQTCEGKFAISVRYWNRVIHVLIRSRPHSETRVEYSVSHEGPFFSSIYDLVKACQRSGLILNDTFDIVLGKSVPRSDRSWFNSQLKSQEEAEETFSNEYREGAFCVYQTPSTDFYCIIYRAEDQVHHGRIVPTIQNRRAGYLFNNIFSPVVYKIVHYFMENPIRANTVLKYPVGHLKVEPTPLCGLALSPSLHPDLEFPIGAIVRNIIHDQENPTLLFGDYEGVTQRQFSASCVHLIRTKEELSYFETENLECAEIPNDLPSDRNSTPSSVNKKETTPTQPLTMGLKPVKLDFSSNVCVVSNKMEEVSDTIVIADSQNKKLYELECPCKEDSSAWMSLLEPYKESSTDKKKHDCCVM